MMGFEAFSAAVRQAFPEVTEAQLELFRLMEGLYTEWNSKINVISRRDIGSLYDHHVLHSLALARYLQAFRPEVYSSAISGATPESGTPVHRIKFLDLGTGGGFPGIPLVVLFPWADFTLCDSIGKKTLVAREVASALGLQNVEVVNARAETLGGGFDFVVSRAVASLSDFYPWVKGKYTQGILYLKGGDVNEEISALMQRFPLRKGSVSAWPISSWLEDEYFAGKFVINIL